MFRFFGCVNSTARPPHFRIHRDLAMTKEPIGDTAPQIPQDCVVRVPPWAWFLLALLAGLGLQRIVPFRFLPPPADALLGWIVVGSGMAR